MKKEILNASLLLPKIHDASTSLWATIKKSHYVEMSARQEVSALNRSACNLEHNLTLAISEIEERIASLEVILSTEAIIPAILSTPDDLSVAFYIAVNGPDIDWPRAEAVLERFLFIWTEQGERMIDSFIRQNVWDHNNFESNIIKLIKGGDCWRVRKSLKLIQNIVVDCTDLGVNVEVFDSLASILLQPLRSSAEDAELKWVYLITKNQDSVIDSDISRLINSFLYSRKGRSSIVHNVLNIISAFVFVQMDHYNDAYDTFLASSKMPETLVKILLEEKENPDVIYVSLNLMHRLMTIDFNSYLDIYSLVAEHRLCEILMIIMDIYSSDKDKMDLILVIIARVIEKGDNISRFLTHGLLKALVQLFESSYYSIHLTDLVKLICCREDYGIYYSNYKERFHKLGIPKGSKFFG